MRRLASRLAAAAACLLVAVIASAALFLAHPETMLTSRIAAAALRRFGGAYAPRWTSFGFSASAAGRGRHRYALRARDFCADEPNGAWSACFAELRLAVVVAYSRTGARVERIDELTAGGGAVTVDLRRVAPGPAARPAVPEVGILSVDVPRFVVRAAGSETKGRLTAALTPGKRRPFSVGADLVNRGSGGVRRVTASFAAGTDLFGGAAPTFVDALARAEVRGVARGRASFRAWRAPSGGELSGELEVAASTGPLAAFRLSACRAAVRGGSGELACRYEAVPVRLPAPGRLGDLKNLTGALRASGTVDRGRFTAEVKAAADPLTAWYELSGDAVARFSGRVGRPPESVDVEARAALKARFEDLVELLKDTDYAVPAPVHVLKGPVSASVESRGDPRADRLVARYVMTTDLAGARQRLIARAAGEVSVSRPLTAERSVVHSGDILLKEVALELPKLAIGPPPKVALDRRIAAAPAGSARPAPFPLAIVSSVTIRTEKPVLLFSNLAKEPVPAALELVSTYPPAAAAGRVSVRKFDVELFRRTATIDHFDVLLSSGSTNGELDGLVLYATPSAAISIHVLGTTERPRVELTSVPPLKREDIIALLIFGKNPDELDPDQTSSVSNTETALESRAFGLASLYLFGATPIEHVGYDTATKTTSVKLRLPGGANLTLGSDFDQSRQLSVRKALSRHWAIQSEITEQGRQSKAATTFLEWFNRY